VGAKQLIGDEWFDFQSLRQLNENVRPLKTRLMTVVYDIQRDSLKIGTQEEILASLRPRNLQREPLWRMFRRKISEIYSFKTGVGSSLDKSVAKRMKAGSKVVGRKEEEKQELVESENVYSDAPNEDNQATLPGTLHHTTKSNGRKHR